MNKKIFKTTIFGVIITLITGCTQKQTTENEMLENMPIIVEKKKNINFYLTGTEMKKCSDNIEKKDIYSNININEYIKSVEITQTEDGKTSNNVVTDKIEVGEKLKYSVCYTENKKSNDCSLKNKKCENKDNNDNDRTYFFNIENTETILNDKILKKEF